VWESDHTRIDATPTAEQEWGQHVAEMYQLMLIRKAKSWFTGYNSNVEGHEYGKTHYLVYNGGTPKYRRRITEVADRGYDGIVFD
jgi:hypothetical protein